MEPSIFEDIKISLGAVLQQLPIKKRKTIKRGRCWEVVTQTEKTITETFSKKKESLDALIGQCKGIREKIIEIGEEATLELDPEECIKLFSDVKKRSEKGKSATERFVSLGTSLIMPFMKKTVTEKELQHLGLSPEALACLSSLPENIVLKFFDDLNRYVGTTETPPPYILPFVERVFNKKKELVWGLKERAKIFRDQLYTSGHPPQVDREKIGRLSNVVLSNVCKILGNFRDASAKKPYLGLSEELIGRIQVALHPSEGKKIDVKAVEADFANALLIALFPHGADDITTPLIPNSWVFAPIQKALHKSMSSLFSTLSTPSKKEKTATKEAPALDILGMFDIFLLYAGKTEGIPTAQALYQKPSPTNLLGELGALFVSGLLPKGPDDEIRTMEKALEKKRISEPSSVGKAIDTLMGKIPQALAKYDGSKEAPPPPLEALYVKEGECYRLGGLGTLLVLTLHNKTLRDHVTHFIKVFSLGLIMRLYDLGQTGELPKNMEPTTLAHFILEKCNPKDLPLPPLLEPFRPVLAQIALEPLTESFKPLLARLTGAKEALPQPAAPSSEKASLLGALPLLGSLSEYPGIVAFSSSLFQTIFTGLLRKKQLAFAETIYHKKYTLSLHGLTSQATDFLDKLIVNLFDSLASMLQNPKRPLLPFLEPLFTKGADNTYVLNEMGTSVLAILQDPETKEHLLLFIKANLYTILAHLLCQGPESTTKFFDKLTPILQTLTASLTSPQATESPIELFQSLKTLIPDVKDLSLPLMPKEMADQANSMLLSLLGKGLQTALTSIDENPVKILELIISPPPIPIPKGLGALLGERKYDAHKSHELARSCGQFFKALFPGSWIPEKVVTWVVNRWGIRFMEIPLARIFDNWLLTAQRENFSLDILLQPTQPLNLTKDQVKTSKEVVQCVFGQSIEDVKKQLAIAKTKGSWREIFSLRCKIIVCYMVSWIIYLFPEKPGEKKSLPERIRIIASSFKG